jgi:hypothetical protein
MQKLPLLVPLSKNLNLSCKMLKRVPRLMLLKLRYIGAEASNFVTSSIRPGKNYWEKVATTQDSGERLTQYKVFSTVTMPEDEFKRAIFEAIRKAQGKGGLIKRLCQKS